MEKKIIYALGLYLLTEQQFYWLICGICQFELIIMLIIMWRKEYFIEKSDIFYLMVSIQMVAYVLFRIEHVTFFFSIFYINIYLIVIYLICKQYAK